MLNIDEIISKEAETDEDIITGNFCECGHDINEEHYKGEITGIVKCYAIRFNGTVYYGCNCTKIIPLKYSVKIMVPDYANNQANAV